jgi:hypothetical protein
MYWQMRTWQNRNRHSCIDVKYDSGILTLRNPVLEELIPNIDFSGKSGQD